MYGINRLTCIPDSTAKIQTSLQTKNNSLSFFLPFAHSFVLCTRYDFQLQSYELIFNYKTIGRKNLAFLLPMWFCAFIYYSCGFDGFVFVFMYFSSPGA